MQYHNKTPHFNHEFKIILPPKLTEKHHFLFTFYHIQCANKKKSEDTETPIGYSVVPLYPNRRIVVHNMEGQYGVSVVSKLEPQYLTKVSNESPKFNFFLRFDLVSTIYPEDLSITQFLNVYHTTEAEVSDDDLVAVLDGLHGLTESLAIQYLPVIINNLLEVMASRVKLEPKILAFRALVLVLHKVTSALKASEKGLARNSLLELYTNYIFDQTFGTKKAIYHDLCSNFLLYMMEKSQTNDKTEDGIYTNSWFFFDLIIKSMTLELNEKESLHEEKKINIFSDSAVRMISKLLDYLSRHFTENMRSHEIKEEIKVLNKNLALFIKDLLLIMDRGIVIDMIKSYLERVTDYSIISISSAFKFDFLRIVTDHDQYIPLNLPFDKGSFSVEELSQKHPLSTIMAYEVLETLKNGDNSSNEIAVGALYDVVVKHASNSKYLSQEKQQCISGIYLILLSLTIENWDELSNWKSKTCFEQKREYYITLLYVLKTADRSLILQWWKQESQKSQIIFYQILNDIIKTFEYSPELKRNTKSLLTPAVAIFLGNAMGSSEAMNDLLKSLSISKHTPEDEDRRLRQLTLEVYTLILDVVEDFIEEDLNDLRNHVNVSPKMQSIISTLALLMNMRQSEKFVHLLYGTLRSFVTKFKNVLFLSENNFVAELVREILLHCNSFEPYLHIEASTLLYILLKLNFKCSGSFGRTRIHTITVLSKLVYDAVIKADVMLNQSFSRLNEYALNSFSSLLVRDLTNSTDDEVVSNVHALFTRGVQELSSTLSYILKDTLRINELRQKADIETIAELYYQIAESYKNTPDLRITWLQSLAKFQEQKGKAVESAMCSVHMAALIADYLVGIGRDIDTSLFATVSPYIKEFSDHGEEGACMSSDFTEKGLITAISNAIQNFDNAEHFEFAAQLYKVLMPIYEAEYKTKELSICCNRLENIWSRVADKDEARLFGTYFRLGFYGIPFGEELNGREFVSKEPKLTHLLELKDKLSKELTKKTGCTIEFIDSSKDVTQIDKSKCFIQVTFVEPFNLTRRDDVTYFERNTDLSQFVYETPFTKGGKAHAESVSEQYKRKTVLTVQHSFPHLLSRLPVIKKKDVILTPIENAIDNIRKRNVQIRSEIVAVQQTNNVKTLQQVLQGSVRLRLYFYQYLFLNFY